MNQLKPKSVVLGILLTLAAAAAWPEEVQIKLGSIVPVNSAWDLALKRLAAEWQSLSGGQVKLINYSGGTAGDEPSIVRKLKLGQLQAAGLSVRGLSQLYPPALALSLPMLMRNDEELDFVLSRLQPDLEAGIEAGGQKVLFWLRLGWTHFYGRQPITRPDDLRKQKLWVWTENPDEATVWKGLSFHTVQLTTADVLIALQTGMVDSFATTPLFAAARQWFALAPHMTQMRWAPLFGALVIKLSTWKRISADLQPRLAAVARRIGDEVREATVRADEEAIGVMQRYGLKTYPVPEAAVAEWVSLADEGFARLMGTAIDATTTRRVRSLLSQFREGAAAR